MITISQLEAAIDASRTDIVNWTKRLELSTSYQETDAGKARMYSRHNALELGIIAALVRGGAAPSTAASLARLFVLDAKHHRLDKWKRWFVFPAGDLNRAIGMDTVNPDSPALADFEATTFSIVDIQRLVGKIDGVFSETAH